MKSISVMHSADMHLGSIISAFERDKNKIRMSEIEYTCMSVLENAKERDIVLLSGDIFDSSDVPGYICDAFLKKISSMPSVQFFYSCGNHDPYVSKTIEYLILNCPDNLHIFGYECVECVTIDRLKARVYGFSFRDSFQKNDILYDIQKCDSSYVNIMCIHGDLADSSVYNPIDISSLEQKGFDYVALGHVHKYSGIQKSGKMQYAYSGNPEPRGFDESGEKGYICGNISKESINLEFVPASKRKYQSISVDISSCSDYLSIVNKIHSNLSSPEDIWRVSLWGENNTGLTIDSELLGKYINAFYVEIFDNTRLPYDIEKIADDFSLIGLCAKNTLNNIKICNEDEKPLYDDAFSVLYNLYEQGRREK